MKENKKQIAKLKVYKIMDLQSGLFATKGTALDVLPEDVHNSTLWSKKGKTWSSLGAVKNAIARGRFSLPNTYLLVTYECTAQETLPVKLVRLPITP